MTRKFSRGDDEKYGQFALNTALIYFKIKHSVVCDFFLEERSGKLLFLRAT